MFLSIRYPLCCCALQNSVVLKKTLRFCQVDLIRGMAGHSKWQNIKHSKAAADAQKGAMTERCLRVIRAAIRTAGTNDPSKDLRLAQAVQNAKENQVPKIKIENALKISTDLSQEALTPYIMEVKGPGGTFLIIETLTDNTRRTSQSVRAALNKSLKFTVIPNAGITKQIFHHKGVINTELSDRVSLESAVDHAIEVGAEEVVPTEDHEGKKVLQFIADAKDFYDVKKNLENLKYTITTAELLYVPQTKQSMTEEDMLLTKKLFDNLEAIPEVIKIHDNIE